MTLYLNFNGASLPGVVGRDNEEQCRISDGKAGHISFGPYFSADPGQYVAGFYIRRIGSPRADTINLDVFANGQKILIEKSIKDSDLFEDFATFVSLPFQLSERVDGIEVRIYVNEGVMIEIQELLVISTKQRMWSAK